MVVRFHDRLIHLGAFHKTATTPTATAATGSGNFGGDKVGAHAVPNRYDEEEGPKDEDPFS